MFVWKKMTSNPYTISPDQTVPDAQEIMQQHNIRRLPVLKNGKLVGVVSKEDILRASPSQATTLSIGEVNYLLAKTKVSKIMTKNPITISPNALLEEAATLMRDNSVSFLPVMDGDKLVGIITESDIFDAFIELLGFRERGTRLTIEAVDAPGIMSKLTSIISNFGANISNVAVYRGTADKSAVVIGMDALNTADIEKALEEEGFKVIYKLQNK
ncbi:MAG: CBS and ACT domain-containing protein [Caldicoprobacterales bacterium]|jgi:acetoin utilization protein AcuB|nr:CBS domain-containing protein [Clostridiales bacterium]